jgi:beta-glucanase (GH16 family)
VRIRKRTVAVLSTLAVGAVVAFVLPLVNGTASAGTSAWEPVWEDTFDAPADSLPDAAKWVYDLGDDGDGWGNSELQTYTDRPENVRHDGAGNLVIAARQNTDPAVRCHYGTCAYTSARITTQGTFSQRFGRFEARIRIPRGPGLLPAFWMLGGPDSRWPRDGEIDIMENIGDSPNVVEGTLWGPRANGSGEYTKSGYRALPVALSDDFHTYAVEGQAGRVSWFVDGTRYLTICKAAGTGCTAYGTQGKWVFDDHAFHLLLNIAVGGDWPKAPPSTVPFPQEMVIDYVRVWGEAPARR